MDSSSSLYYTRLLYSLPAILRHVNGGIADPKTRSQTYRLNLGWKTAKRFPPWASALKYLPSFCHFIGDDCGKSRYNKPQFSHHSDESGRPIEAFRPWWITSQIAHPDIESTNLDREQRYDKEGYPPIPSGRLCTNWCLFIVRVIGVTSQHAKH